jgi:hypothetical protein
MKFYRNTDTVDIAAKSLGISNNQSHKDRGLTIQIRHNKDKELFKEACKIQEVIVNALNEFYKNNQNKE